MNSVTLPRSRPFIRALPPQHLCPCGCGMSLAAVLYRAGEAHKCSTNPSFLLVLTAARARNATGMCPVAVQSARRAVMAFDPLLRRPKLYITTKPWDEGEAPADPPCAPQPPWKPFPPVCRG